MSEHRHRSPVSGAPEVTVGAGDLDGNERTIVVQTGNDRASMTYALDELALLADSAGAEVTRAVAVRLRRPTAATYLRPGQIEQLRDAVVEDEASLVVFSAELSPAQERNLEKKLECRVLNKSGLILDIFAQRAQTREGMLQVELAQLNHLRTRLVRGWTHLERQKGGIGMHGPGESQLETDRRLIQNRLRWLEKQVDKIRLQREQSRRPRQRAGLATVALVGYTNAGKSTLFRALCGDKNVYCANKLFATLDPTVRRLLIPGVGDVAVVDTVGFISGLPHHLVHAFRATLDEVRTADLLVHVIDSSHPDMDECISNVEQVLESLDASEIPRIDVYNKIDINTTPATPATPATDDTSAHQRITDPPATDPETTDDTGTHRRATDATDPAIETADTASTDVASDDVSSTATGAASHKTLGGDAMPTAAQAASHETNGVEATSHKTTAAEATSHKTTGVDAAIHETLGGDAMPIATDAISKETTAAEAADDKTTGADALLSATDAAGHETVNDDALPAAIDVASNDVLPSATDAASNKTLGGDVMSSATVDARGGTDAAHFWRTVNSTVEGAGEADGINEMASGGRGRVAVSARCGTGIDKLGALICAGLQRSDVVQGWYRFAPVQHKMRAHLHAMRAVLKEEFNTDGSVDVFVRLRASRWRVLADADGAPQKISPPSAQTRPSPEEPSQQTPPSTATVSH
ncbi:MAG: GTPase HflX [Proteobacteria bacterium]|nr:GTPase HflX [Pseudomonadota bacterium]